MRSRAELLVSLLGYMQSLEKTLTELQQFEWDVAIPLIVLKPNHVTQLLERYLRNELTEADVEAWANAIEGREDIDYEDGYDDMLHEVIYVLANPLLTEPLDKVLAKNMIANLQ